MVDRDERVQEPAEILLGYVAGVFGVQGWVKLHSYTEPRDALLGYRQCSLKAAGERRESAILEGRRQGKGLIARIEGVDDRDTAAALVGAEITVPRSALPPLPEGRYYWADLEGLRVRTSGNDDLGRVSHLMATGANDVLVVEKGEHEVLIPFVLGEVVLDVDIAAGCITVDWDKDW